MRTSKSNDARYDFLFRLVTGLFEEQVRKNPPGTAVSEVVSAYAYLLSQIGVNDKRVMSKRQERGFGFLCRILSSLPAAWNMWSLYTDMEGVICYESYIG